MPGEQTDTIVGANVELKGSLKNQGPIHIHGKVIGDVFSDSLVVIGETAVIQGPITAKQVDVAGQVFGSINAEEQLELQPKSLVKGDIITGRLSIKAGAIFIGKSQMESAEVSSVLEESEDSFSAPDKKRPRLEVD